MQGCSIKLLGLSTQVRRKRNGGGNVDMGTFTTRSLSVCKLYGTTKRFNSAVFLVKERKERIGGGGEKSLKIVDKSLEREKSLFCGWEGVV